MYTFHSKYIPCKCTIYYKAISTDNRLQWFVTECISWCVVVQILVYVHTDMHAHAYGYIYMCKPDTYVHQTHL